ncbi:uncharacterized protein PFL1_02486 [Pseudozyma flocculosa PF-1]|uniref:Related to LCP5 - U3 small nucleolar ribonucleoprotein involved in maturation of 18S rRNA n=2 Tax=Pseudozyma flocculosa TaxID=84751 RepID=A0A5C3EXV3_9BASI|nr:uncharacterized protein PFL1_02486 [Pseudozyma flocculosa PF-1]EPQ29813.1 hypothetical protein PFL1_02486 [Pseudozyma flocculosa PF-1]SPO37103.1 related to LCP5 - U3 small nucleolar ribonucleoprotein involved in maturation of 18S rRNA [Pseudozyma flocculosa]
MASATASSSQSSAIGALLKSLQKDVASVASTLTTLCNDIVKTPSSFTYPDGISLLTLKNDVLLDYLHHLVLLSAWKMSGNSLTESHGARLVRNLVKLRLVLEKVKPLESRLRYQVEKLLRAAEDEDREIALGRVRPKAKDEDEVGEEEDEEEETAVDLLAFRPNPSAFMDDKARPDRSDKVSSKTKTAKRSKKDAGGSSSESESDSGGKTAVYRPPKLAPVAYDPDASSSKRGRDSGRGSARSSALLADLTAGLSSNPYEISSGGVGVGGSVASQQSARARALQRMQDYEEDNFTRLVMSKRDAKKRMRDEADVALGGAGLSSGRDGQRRVGGGIEEEFGDLLRTGGYSGAGKKGKKARRSEDAFESLRGGSAKPNTLQRARKGGSRGADSPRSGGSKTFKNKLNKRK